ncbi:MAG: hypothetical protein HQL97_14250 [Magnetococcales bacterium]|nr:hypothetical protein [Magnetococcales bacterium]
MLVIVVSACLRTAWPKTRAIVDAYLERAGERTWRGRLTQEGLDRLRLELTAVATRQTSVATSVVTRHQRFELAWIVGSARPFGPNGQFCTYNGQAYDRYFEQDPPRPGYFIQLNEVCGLAGLWHDVGKANADFQDKLRRGTRDADPIRHEILSACLFIATMRRLLALHPLTMEAVERAIQAAAREPLVLARVGDPIDLTPTDLPPPLRLTAWLIASHHRLPDAAMTLQSIPDGGLFKVTEHVNSAKLPHRIALDTRICRSGWLIGGTFHRLESLLDPKHPPWPEEDATGAFYGRVALILADQSVSRQGFVPGWHGNARPGADELCANYETKPGLAGIDADTGLRRRVGQSLEVHLSQVDTAASCGLSDLLDLRDAAPALESAGLPRNLRGRAPEPFDWQNQAVERVREGRRPQAGFFGELMAGTGAGKTRAAPKILAAAGKSLRHTLCLPLRSLTLQAGNDYRADLGLNDLEVVTVIGSDVMRELYEQRDSTPDIVVSGARNRWVEGSESAWEETELEVDATRLEIRNALQHKLPPNLWQNLDRDKGHFLAAPVVVATIDQMMPVADGRRTGHALAAMRLLSADLVLDEIDGYDAEDQIAIGRLVYWAGVCGRKVIIASATVTQPHAEGLFRAYRAGYAAYARFHGLPIAIDVGLFADSGELARLFAGEAESDYQAETTRFRAAIATALAARPPLRRGLILPRVTLGDPIPLFETMRSAILALHRDHHQSLARGQQRLSGLLVRLAHIRSCVNFAAWLVNSGGLEGVNLKIILYHAGFPVQIRDRIERFLDEAFKRKNKRQDRFAHHPQVKAWLRDSRDPDHILLVIATSVEELGRDHDFDGCILEPTSEHAKTQCAGRVNRHRQLPVTTPNVYLLPTTLRAVGDPNERYPFRHPGPQGNTRLACDRSLPSPWIEALLRPEQVAIIDARPHLLPDTGGALTELEQRILRDHLLDPEACYPYSLRGFWRADVQARLSGAHAKEIRFRRSSGSLTVWYDADADEFKTFVDNSPLSETIRPSGLILGRFDFLRLDWKEIAREALQDETNPEKRRRFLRRYFQVSLAVYPDQSPTRYYSNAFGLYQNGTEGEQG